LPYARDRWRTVTGIQALSTVIDLAALMTPVTHSSPKYGWADWIHYACKPFDDEDAVGFTAKFFEADAVQSQTF